jgi:thiol-disulfide isomerase/thioredoxin
MRRLPWDDFLTGALTTILIAAVGGLVVFRIIEARISESFSAPQFNLAAHMDPAVAPQNDFAVTALDGRVQQLSAMKGKIVFVNLWAVSCLRCSAEMPTIQRLYNTFRGDPSIAFVIASHADSPEKVRWYARLSDYDLPFYTVRDSDVPASLRPRQFPATYVFAKDGALVARQIGGADWNSPAVARALHQLEAK